MIFIILFILWYCLGIYALLYIEAKDYGKIHLGYLVTSIGVGWIGIPVFLLIWFGDNMSKIVIWRKKEK